MSNATKKTGSPKGKPTAKKAVAGRQTVAAIETPQTAALPPTLKVIKADCKYEGARAAWYAALREHDGQSAEAFVGACTKKPPSMPKNGKAEDPRGWLRYFVREGVASLS